MLNLASKNIPTVKLGSWRERNFMKYLLSMTGLIILLTYLMSETLASFYFQAECWHLKLISGQLMFETQFSWPMAPLIADHPYSVTFHDGFPIYSLLSGIVLRPSIFVCALIYHDGVAIFLVYTNTYVSGCFVFLWSDKKKHSEFFYSFSEILGSHT